MPSSVIRQLRPFPTPEEVDDVIARIAADADRRLAGDGEPPVLAIDLVREHRLGAARVPIELGGGGFSLRELVELFIRIGAADSDVPHILRVHFEFVETLLTAHARGATDDRWLQTAVDGRVFGGANSELTAPVVGSYDHRTTLTAKGDTYRLDGTKFYTTGSLYADHIRVAAHDTGTDGPVAVIIPAHRDGVEHLDDWDGFGQTHTASGTIVFRDVEVRPEEIHSRTSLADEDIDRNTLVHVNLHATAAGILERVARDAADQLHRRGRTYTFASTPELTADPQLLQTVGELSSAAYVARAAVLDAADHLDAAARAKWAGSAESRPLQEAAALAAARLKVGIEPLALKAAGELFDVGGASAIRGPAHLDRHWRNLRTLFSHHPTVYKARTIGDLLVNGTPLPRNGFY